MSKLRSTSDLTPKHSHLMAERHYVGLYRRPGKRPTEQIPDNRLQEIKHHRWIVARSIKWSRPITRIRFLVGTGVVVDLSGVTIIDSSGVACLLEAFNSVRHRGKGFILASVDESILRVLKLARLDTVFEIADDVEAARRARP